MMYGYIYKTTNLITNKMYIGQHKAKQFQFDTYKGSGIQLSQDFKLYGWENFKCELLESINNIPTICDSREQLNTSEQYYIDYYDCVRSDNYYNLTEGGIGGDKISDLSLEAQKERALKISKKLKGHKLSESTKEKIKLKNIEYYSDETNYQLLVQRNRARYENDPTLRERISISKRKIYEENPELRREVSDRQRAKWQDESYVQKQKASRKTESYLNKMRNLKNNLNKIIINKDGKEKMIDPQFLDTYLNDGWVKGRCKFSEETKEKMRQAALNRRKHKKI